MSSFSFPLSLIMRNASCVRAINSSLLGTSGVATVAGACVDAPPTLLIVVLILSLIAPMSIPLDSPPLGNTSFIALPNKLAVSLLLVTPAGPFTNSNPASPTMLTSPGAMSPPSALGLPNLCPGAPEPLAGPCCAGAVDPPSKLTASVPNFFILAVASSTVPAGPNTVLVADLNASNVFLSLPNSVSNSAKPLVRPITFTAARCCVSARTRVAPCAVSSTVLPVVVSNFFPSVALSTAAPCCL